MNDGETSLESGGLLLRLRRSSAPYLSVVLASTVVAQIVHYVVPFSPTFKGQALAIILQYAMFGVAFVLWVIYRGSRSPSRALTVFLAVVALQWIVLMYLGWRDGTLFNEAALLFLPALLMVWWKPPEFVAVRIATDVVAWGLIAISIASQVLDVAGLRSMNHEFVLRWPFMTELFGVTTRWEGPFGNVNYAGPIGAFLLVYGVCRTSWTRGAFIAAGLVILVASEARTSIAATAAGVGTVLVFSQRIGPFRLPAWVRIAAAAVGLSGLLIVLVGPDSDLNSRTPLWSTYLQLWESTPVLGVGTSRINEAITAGAIPGWAPHAHSVYLDTLVRNGILGLAVTLAALVVGAWITVRAARHGSVVGVALLVTFIVGGLTETILDWRYLSIEAVSMVVAVLLGATWLQDHDSSRPPDEAPLATVA